MTPIRIGIFIWLICWGVLSSAISQNPKAIDILQKCITYHDPNSLWDQVVFDFDMTMTRNQTNKDIHVTLDIPNQIFKYSKEERNRQISHTKSANSYQYTVDDIVTQDSTVINELGLNSKNTEYLRETYYYLMGIPMKLIHDTIYLSPQISKIGYNGEVCYKLTFDYYPKPENETWHFFISTVDYRLLGYQFFVKSEEEDGEYILLSDFANMNGIIVPKKRNWYWNATHTLFREDHIK